MNDSTKVLFPEMLNDYKDFELTEMAYPLFSDSNIPFKVISFDKIIHRVNPIAPRYLENEESVNEVSRVLIENLLEQRESGTTGTTKFFNDAAEGPGKLSGDRKKLICKAKHQLTALRFQSYI